LKKRKSYLNSIAHFFFLLSIVFFFAFFLFFPLLDCNGDHRENTTYIFLKYKLQKEREKENESSERKKNNMYIKAKREYESSKVINEQKI